MPWKPLEPDERPTLGPIAIDWIESQLARPDTGEGLVTLTQEQIDFALRFYELDPDSCIRRYRRGVLSRPKGWGRSPFLAMLAAAEAFAPVVPAGWDAKGRPVGKPWRSVRTPWVQVLAVSEDQTRNSWMPLLSMLRDGPLAALRGVDVLATFVVLPGGGRIEYATASAVSREGNRPVFAILDQTESWTPSNGGTRLAAAVRRNLGKIAGSSVESPNSYRPGSESVSEKSYEYAARILDGSAKDDGLLWDHREAPPETEMGDDASLLAGLRHAYGDSADRPCVIHDPPCDPQSWGAPLSRIMREVADLDTDPADSRQFYLNQPSAEETAAFSAQEWDANEMPGVTPDPPAPRRAPPRLVGAR